MKSFRTFRLITTRRPVPEPNRNTNVKRAEDNERQRGLTRKKSEGIEEKHKDRERDRAHERGSD